MSAVLALLHLQLRFKSVSLANTVCAIVTNCQNPSATGVQVSQCVHPQSCFSCQVSSTTDTKGNGCIQGATGTTSGSICAGGGNAQSVTVATGFCCDTSLVDCKQKFCSLGASLVMSRVILFPRRLRWPRQAWYSAQLLTLQ